MGFMIMGQLICLAKNVYISFYWVPTFHFQFDCALVYDVYHHIIY